MKKWRISPSDANLQKYLSGSLSISPVIAQLLINRGMADIDKIKSFLKSDVSELYNPFLMKGMSEAVSRIKRALAKKEKILIHGDYDVDGVTATALLFFGLKEFGAEPVYFIPDRLTEGYGLGSNGVEEAVKIKASLVITVDCGISSHEEVEALNKHGIDVVVTDHHEPPRILPDAHAVINPHQKGCAYPDKFLSGVSIAFKLCQALGAELNSRNFWKHLDLVALGTVSDMAPILGENRILVKEGLKLLKNGGSNKGVKALIEVSGIKKDKIGAFEIGFILGPRINAAGRLGYAGIAVELLLTEDDTRARELAKKLNEANQERQKIEKNTLKEALSKMEKDINFKDHRVIVLHNEDWHAGVMGIVASRISDRFNRPAILISTKDGVGRGSGRSIENFHLFEALASCEGFLKEYGGHQYACGLTILEENLPGFIKLINELAKDTMKTEDLTQSLSIDMETGLDALDRKTIEDIEALEPFGEGNPEPVFCSRNLRLAQPVRVLKGEHLKFQVTDGKKKFDAIGFGMAKDGDIELALKDCGSFDMAYTVSINNWQGINTIQLKIEDIKPS
ncbi:MAG: single-stranded-DNA-specific exonuclease RecJ [Candidatus Omnitrophica bacterium CG22_combo_CG10-13_8_21_14_all_43_16]|nr:MAG: single-stranded-DNA-specific exonuclease RecJ [Candidatus Omnitrophica bacterium CG22_combo_CG10-13_8_21_14_all_43_16]